MELDVYLTKDDVVVCSHDNTLNRLCNRADVKISETNFTDLPPLSSEIPLGEDPGDYVQTAEDDGQWLKLEDLFVALRGTVLYSIDLKFSDKDKVQLVYLLIKNASLVDKVVWGSGN